MENLLKQLRDFPPDLKALARMRPLSAQTLHGCLTEVLARCAPIVVERLTFPPNLEIPRHRHPNVSAFEYGVRGNGRIFVGRHEFANDEQSPKRRPVYLARNRVHGGIVGAKGALVISVQYWHIWPPAESIGLDWEAVA